MKASYEAGVAEIRELLEKDRDLYYADSFRELGTRFLQMPLGEVERV